MLFPVEALTRVAKTPGATAGPGASGPSAADPGASPAASARGEACLPASWAGFAGHFPGRPVVPAYVLLGLVRAVAAVACGEEAAIASVERVKLTRPVGPDETITCAVAVEPRGALSAVRAQLSVAAGPVGTVSLSIRVGR